VPPSFIATSLTEVMKSLARKAIPIEKLTEEQIFEIFKLIDEGKMTKEMFPDIAEKLVQKGGGIRAALQQLGLKRISTEELSRLVDVQAKENLDFIKKNPDRAFNHLMKRVMGQVRGQVDAKIVSQTVREKLKKLSTP
jgi:glutamyl-tRNA(Gln) amidotransferase subunit E